MRADHNMGYCCACCKIYYWDIVISCKLLDLFFFFSQLCETIVVGIYSLLCHLLICILS